MNENVLDLMLMLLLLFVRALGKLACSMITINSWRRVRKKGKQEMKQVARLS